MKKTYLVRNAEAQDVPTLLSLLRRTDLFWEPGDTADAYLQKLRHDPESILVLEHEKSVVGMVMTIYDPWQSFIWHLAIDPHFQEMGFGSALTNAAEERLRTRGTACVCCFVLPDNKRSLSFFRRRGYSEYFSQVISLEKAVR